MKREETVIYYKISKNGRSGPLEQISGVNNWKLVIRREAAGVTILRAETCDRKAALPE